MEDRGLRGRRGRASETCAPSPAETSTPVPGPPPGPGCALPRLPATFLQRDEKPGNARLSDRQRPALLWEDGAGARGPRLPLWGGKMVMRPRPRPRGRASGHTEAEDPQAAPSPPEALERGSQPGPVLWRQQVWGQGRCMASTGGQCPRAQSPGGEERGQQAMLRPSGGTAGRLS